MTGYPDSQAYQSLAILNRVVSLSLNYVVRHINKQNPVDVIEGPWCVIAGEIRKMEYQNDKNKVCLDFFFEGSPWTI